MPSSAEQPSKPPDPMKSVANAASGPGPRQLKRLVKLNVVQSLAVISSFASDIDAEIAWEPQILSSGSELEQIHSVRATEFVPIEIHTGIIALKLPSSLQLKTTLKHRFPGEVWLQALHALSILLDNTVVCVAWAWFANFAFSRGNIFFGTPVAKQSDFEFLAGTLMLLHTNFYCIIAVVHVPVLWQWQFVSLPSVASNPVKFVHICSKLLRYTWAVFTVSGLLNLGTVFALRGAPAKTKAFKIEFYVSCLWIHLHLSAISVAARRIFLLETAEGELKLSSYQAANQVNRAFTTRFFWKMYFYTFPKICVVWFADIFVQVTSQFKIESLEDFVWFTSGSLVLKLVAKEITKFAVVSFDVKDLRSVSVVAGIPTVIIDTQIRIMIQKEQSVKYTLGWTSAMAIYEIVTRVAKVGLTARQIRLKQARVMDSVGVATGVQVVPSGKADTKNSGPTEPPLVQASETQTITGDGFEKWRRQIRAFQIVESYANMSTEYIAIGCSTSILYFYWNHPKYELSGHRDTSIDSASTSASASWPLGYTICVQIAVEVLVDFVSCALEISEGIDFQAIRKYRGFLGLLFTSIALLNIQICALIYFNDG